MTAGPRALTPSQIEPSEIRRVTAEVLARPDLQDAGPGLLQRAQRWGVGQLARLIDLLGQGAGGRVVGTVVLVAAIAALVVLTLLLRRRVRRDPGAAARPTGIGGRSARDWEALARRAEAAGDWAGALRCGYRALLSELIAAGTTDEVIGRTAREYLRDVSDAAPAARQPLAWITGAFEATWYDRRPVDRDDLAELRRASDEVRRAALVRR